MCGRYTYKFTWSQLRELLDLHRIPVKELAPNENVAPTDTAPVVRQNADGREGVMMRWGLVPAWAESIQELKNTFNARADTLETKPSYRSAFKTKRCVVPVTGFIEWIEIIGVKRKQKLLIHSPEMKPVYLAGLWETWDKGATPLESFTVVTTDPNAMMAKIHTRMPVVLDEEGVNTWLDPNSSPEQLRPLMRPAPDGVLTMSTMESPVPEQKSSKRKPQDDGSTLFG